MRQVQWGPVRQDASDNSFAFQLWFEYFRIKYMLRYIKAERGALLPDTSQTTV